MSFERIMDSKIKPNVYIIAGPNGAGKTTFATDFLPRYAKCRNFVNADLIAKGIAPFAPEAAAITAGRMLIQQIRAFADQKVDFAFETTLSGQSYKSFIKKLKTKGYIVHIFFLWIPDVNLALARVKERVSRGGHNIPAEDVKRRFPRSFKNFVNDFMPLVDHWMVFDNSSKESHRIANGEPGNIEIIDQDLYKQIFH